MAAAGPSSTTNWTECLEQCREILRTSTLSVDILLGALVSNGVVTTEEAANAKQLSTEALARKKIDYVLDLLISKEIAASEIFFQTIKVHEPWTIERLQLEGIPVSQFLECDALTTEPDKVKVTESEASDSTAPPRTQTVSVLEEEENWNKLRQLWFRATKLQFGEGVPVVPLVQVSCDSTFTEDDPVAKYVKQSVHTNGRLSGVRQFGTYENVVNETRGAVGIVTLEKLPGAEESEAIIQIYECFRSKGGSFVLVFNYDTFLSTQSEKPRVLRCLLGHCKRKTTKDYMKVAQGLSSSIVFPPLEDSEFVYKYIKKLGLQTCKRIAERTSPSSVQDVENMIKELEQKDPNTSPLSDTAKNRLFKLSFVKGFCVMAETPHIYIHEDQFGNRGSHKQVHDIVSPYFGDHYFILEYSNRSRFVPLVSFKPGEAIFRNPSDPKKYGTLGALLEVRQGPASEKHDWYALTCEHVVGKSASMMIRTGENSFYDFGEVVYKRDVTKTEKDVALIKIKRSFYPTDTRGHIDVRRDLKGIQMQKVRKMGAQTGETYGIVAGTDCEFPDCGRDFILLCSKTRSARFAEGGDSGSVVLLEDDNKVEALSILVGKFEIRDDVSQLEVEGRDHTTHSELEESELPITGPSVEDSASSASDMSGHYGSMFSPLIPEDAQVFYSDSLTVSLDQIKNKEEAVRNKILDYIDEVSRHHSLLFVRRVDPRKPAATTRCMLCRKIRGYRPRFFYLHIHQPPCKKAVERVLHFPVDNEQVRDNLANRYMADQSKFPRLLKHAPKIRLHVQPCELKAGGNQEDDDINDNFLPKRRTAEKILCLPFQPCDLGAEENQKHGDYDITPKKRLCQETLGFRDQSFHIGAKENQEHDNIDDDNDLPEKRTDKEMPCFPVQTFGQAVEHGGNDDDDVLPEGRRNEELLRSPVQPCYLEAKETQERDDGDDDDDDDRAILEWEEEYTSITGCRFVDFLNAFRAIVQEDF